MRLIVFDDDSRIANFLALVARERGWTVEVTLTEREFRSLCTSGAPDAIFLDLALGNSDGIEQLRFLHQINFCGVVTLMSGFDARVLASAEQVGRSLGLALTQPLKKPMRAAEVRTALDAIWQRIGMRLSEASRSAATPDVSSSGDLRPADISAAIERGEMVLFFQPILAAADNSVAHLEALIRWRHPSGKLWYPDAFLPLAERDNAVIDQLSMWVIDSALLHHRELAASGFRIPIAVNVSGANLRSLSFPDAVAARVVAAGVPPSALAFEVTEGVAIADTRATMDVLTRLRLKGFDIAIDDLGMGHSSLHTLRQMPFSQIKIDKTFVAGIFTSHDSLAIVSSVINLARSMGVISVAEGVETQEAAQLLRDLGIDRLQGYFFSRALPHHEMAVWLQNWAAQHQGALQHRGS